MSTTAATARYVIAADDRTKAAIYSVNKNFDSMHKHVQGIVKNLNAALGIFIGANVKQAFQSVIRLTEEAAGPTSDFAKSLNDVRSASRDLMTSHSGLPEISSEFQKLADVLRDPQVQDTFDKMITFMVTTAAKGGQAVGKFAGGVGVVLKRMGLMKGSTLQDEIDKLDREIAAEEFRLNNGSRGNADFRYEQRADSKKRLEELRARQRALLFPGESMRSSPQIPAPFAPELDIPALTTAGREAAKKAADEYAAYMKKANEETMTDIQRQQAKIGDYAKKLIDLQNNKKNPMSAGEAQQRWQEFLDKELPAIEVGAKKIAQEFEFAGEKMSVYAEEAARNMQDAFAQFLFDPFQGGIRGMLSSFVNVIRRMVAETAAARIFEGATAKGGWLSGLLGAFLPGAAGSGTATAGAAAAGAGGSSWLTGSWPTQFGARAGGGSVRAGRAYRINENTPNSELFIPGVSGSIVPGMRGGGITYAPVINIDSRSDRQAVMADVQRVLQSNNRELMTQLTRYNPGIRT